MGQGACRLVALVGSGLALAALLAPLALGKTPPVTDGPGDVKAVVKRGDSEAGRTYLLHGDYLGAGIPMAIWKQMNLLSPPAAKVLEREGVDPSVPYDMNQYRTPSGVEVVSGVNCLGCHSSMFRGELVIGMGNSLRDWPAGPSMTPALRLLGAVQYQKESPEREVLEQFIRGADALSGKVSTPFRGPNPAFRFEEVAAARRNPEDLSWSNEPLFEYPAEVVWSDVPAWWNVRKKTALYYNAMGHGDFARLIQQIGVVMMGDARDAERTLPHMRDVLAYIDTLRPPVHPGPIDEARAARGAAIFAERCAECHGTYADRLRGGDAADDTYPGKVIDVEDVGTDARYAQHIMSSGIHGWFNRGWFAGGGAAYARPRAAYIAPPLDGVWCTAPYFHNGSVPTLEGVLDSSSRPALWRRTFRDDDYDIESPGWRYEAVSAEAVAEPSREVYDTRVPGAGNQGHTYGDGLAPEERRDLIEYLKTL